MQLKLNSQNDNKKYLTNTLILKAYLAVPSSIWWTKLEIDNA